MEDSLADQGVSRRTMLQATGTAGLVVGGAAVLDAASSLTAHAANTADRTHRTRRDLVLRRGWRFVPEDVDGAEAPDFDDNAWAAVELPHSWNAFDGTDAVFYRGPGWYRLQLKVPGDANGQRLFLQFDGAYVLSEVWIDGQHVGRHAGGFSTFRFDITDALGSSPAGKTVTLAVRVESTEIKNIAPRGGDYTHEGGIYRPVHLLMVDPVHIDLLDFGGPGVYVRQNTVTPVAELDALIRVTNDSTQATSASVSFVVRDARQRPVARTVREVTVKAGETAQLSIPARVVKPRLWHGTIDPYLYEASAEVRTAGADDGDVVTVPLGLRTMSVDADRGFLLNGKPYRLHGVNAHQTAVPGRGVAASDADIDADYRLISELGVASVRMAHYPHAQRAYDNCDRLGLVAYSEVALTGATDSAAFLENVSIQMREMIRQNYNHPSVAFWGIGNEVGDSSDYVNATLAQLAAIGRQEDPQRLTVYAHCCRPDTDRMTNHSDLSGYNRYWGWYFTPEDGFGPWADDLHATDPARRISVTEYGAGASPIHHEQDPAWPEPKSFWHPEEWQAQIHETNWRHIEERPFIWGSYIWMMFDHPSGKRKDEGDRLGINDKGLITLDRTVKKDAFYWYKANWTTDPMVHITSARDTPRFTETTAIKVYANVESVDLTVNGRSIGRRTVDGHIAAWDDVPLQPGRNIVKVVGRQGRKRVVDQVEWHRSEHESLPELAVNSGSKGGYLDDTGRHWEADYNASPSWTGRTRTAIAGTADGHLYASYRTGYFAYRLPLDNGTYEVALKFVEPEENSSLRRIFDVNVQRQRVLNNLDIFAEVGRNAALDKTFDVTVANGLLELEFVPNVGQAIVSGIRATPIG